MPVPQVKEQLPNRIDAISSSLNCPPNPQYNIPKRRVFRDTIIHVPVSFSILGRNAIESVLYFLVDVIDNDRGHDP